MNGLLYVVGSTKTPNDPAQAFNCSPQASQFEFPLCEYPAGYFQNRLNGTSAIPDPTNNWYDGFIMRFRLSNLAMDWSTYFGGAFDEGIWDVAVDYEGQVYVAGWSETPQYAGNACAAPNDDGFPKCDAQGYFSSVANTKQRFIARFDEEAKLTWSTKFGDNTNFANGGFEPISLAIDQENRVYLHHSSYYLSSGYTPPMPLLATSGLYHNPIHNDALQGGRSDTYVTMFSGGTHHLYTTFLGGIGNDIARGITATTERLYVCGYTLSLLNFPTHAPVIQGHAPYLNSTPLAVVAQNRADGYVAQLRYDLTIGIEEPVLASPIGLVLFPNPNSGTFQVVVPEGFSGRGELQIVDELGRLVQRHGINGDRLVSLSVQGLANGIYSAVLLQGDKRWQGRVVIMD